MTTRLREYVKEILREAAQTPENMPQGVFVTLSVQDDYIYAAFTDAFNRTPIKLPLQGNVDAVLSDDLTGPTLGAFVIATTNARSGWGPLLYDVVMEKATELGHGLSPDRSLVSNAALRVWTYYLNNRPDVTTKQLDFAPDYDVHITDDPNDDSNMQDRNADLWAGAHRIDKKSEKWSARDDTKRALAQKEYLAGPLSKVYFSTGTPTIDKLRMQGRLIEI